MSLLEKQLFIKRSSILSAGKGLFTKQHIAKGTRITGYKGKVTTWKKVLQAERQTGIINEYLYYINRNRVIDGSTYIKALAKYANDANGPGKIRGLVNNSKYVEFRGRVFMEATKDIPAGAEILVSYGREYWI